MISILPEERRIVTAAKMGSNVSLDFKGRTKPSDSGITGTEPLMTQTLTLQKPGHILGPPFSSQKLHRAVKMDAVIDKSFFLNYLFSFPKRDTFGCL